MNDSPSHVEIGVLSILVVIHSIFIISSTLSIVVFSLGKSYLIIDILAAFIVLSFLLCRRCVFIDIYEYVKADIHHANLPDIAKDNYYINRIKKAISKKTGKKRSKGLYKERLDIISNIKDLDSVKFNHKMHYIIVNIILSVILIVKVNVKLLPLLITWLFMVFPL